MHGGPGYYGQDPYGQPGYGQQQQYPQDPYAQGELPHETASGGSVSSSDREEVEEAREEYNDAVRSGDREEIEEAREEYNEAAEDAYGSD